MCSLIFLIWLFYFVFIRSTVALDWNRVFSIVTFRRLCKGRGIKSFAAARDRNKKDASDRVKKKLFKKEMTVLVGGLSQPTVFCDFRAFSKWT